MSSHLFPIFYYLTTDFGEINFNVQTRPIVFLNLGAYRKISQVLKLIL